MILVTIGTNEQPFDRLIRGVAALDRDDLYVQHGSSRVPHGRGEWVDFVPFDTLVQKAAEADAVICHAGVGSILVARRAGHVPIVVARRHHLGEAVDDHQLSLGRRLHDAGIVSLVDDHELPAALDAVHRGRAAAMGGPSLEGAAALSAAVRGALVGLGAVPVSGRAA